MIQEALSKKDIVNILRANGLKTGMIIEVHSSLSSFGYVIGGAQSVVDALMEVVGYQGTIVMSCQVGDNTEPTYWGNPPLVPEQVKKFREEAPGFRKKETDLYKMGKIADNFYRREGVIISSHPNCAFMAWGKYAKLLCNHQSLHFPLSEESACARLYELKASVLLLGVDYDNCTSMHLGEYRSDTRRIVLQGGAIDIDGVKEWKKFIDIDSNSKDFLVVGNALEKQGFVKQFKIGNCKVKMFNCDIAIDAVEKFLKQYTLYSRYQKEKSS